MTTTKSKTKNIRVRTAYGVSGVEVSLSLQELFQLSMKADILGQHIVWLRDQKKDVPEFEVIQLEELGNFLNRILHEAGFEKSGRCEIFSPVEGTK